MKFLKDKKIVGLIVVLVVFTVIYFVAVNKVSYAFSDVYDVNDSYHKTIDTIKKCAEAYGEQNLDMFKKDNIVYIKVQDLIDNKMLVPNSSGNIDNPLKNNETLNSNIIKLKYEDEKIIVEVDI